MGEGKQQLCKVEPANGAIYGWCYQLGLSFIIECT